MLLIIILVSLEWRTIFPDRKEAQEVMEMCITPSMYLLSALEDMQNVYEVIKVNTVLSK